MNADHNDEPDALITTDEMRQLLHYTQGQTAVHFMRLRGYTHADRQGVNGQLLWSTHDVDQAIAESPRIGQIHDNPDAEVTTGSVVRIKGGYLPYEVEDITHETVALRAQEPRRRGQPERRIVDIKNVRILKDG